MRLWMQPRAAALLPNLDSIVLRLMAAADAAAQRIPRYTGTHDGCIQKCSRLIKVVCEKDEHRGDVATACKANMALCRHHAHLLQHEKDGGSVEQEWARWADFATWMTILGASAALNRAAGGSEPLTTLPIPAHLSVNSTQFGPLLALLEPILFADLLRHVAEHPELSFMSGRQPPEGWQPAAFDGYEMFLKAKPAWLVEILDADWVSTGVLDRPSELILNLSAVEGVANR